MEEKEIILNRAKCLSCGDIVTSYGVHDYITCSCGKLSVDGGTAYLRRAYNDITLVEELSVYSDAPFEIIRENYHRGGRGKNNDEPLRWVPLFEMSDSWLKNCIIYNDERNLSKSMMNYFYLKELRYRKRMEISILDK